MAPLASAQPAKAAADPPPPIKLDAVSEYSRAIVSAVPEATVIVIGGDERVWLAEGWLLEERGTNGDGLVGQTLAGIQDVAHCHMLTKELGAERERLQTAEEMAGFGHWEVDLGDGTAVFSRGMRRLLALPPRRHDRRFQLEKLLAYVGPADQDRFRAALRQVVETGSGEFEIDVPRRHAPPRRVLMRGRRATAGDGREVVAGVALDTTALQAAERSRAESDALFRQGFEGSPIGMAIIDPPTRRYVKVNDALCRLVGRSREELLQLTFADVTHEQDHETDEAGRSNMVDGLETSYSCEKRYVRADGRSVWVSVHVVPIYDSEQRLQGFFSQVVDRTAAHEREEQLLRDVADLERLRELRAALADNRLVLCAQPIIDLATNLPVQQELLVRLRREDGSVLPPAQFLPLAERFGCMDEIDEWVTRQAVQLAAAGRSVSVNLSAASVGDDGMLAIVREALEQTQADPSRIVFEVTETALMVDLEAGRRFASALRDLGCQFALDDFGTGYGTLTYLKHIPIDYIKIDVEFVRDLLRSDADELLVRTIVGMAREFGKRTIAEGVEDEPTLQRLRALGVDFAQGYFLGRPAPLT